MRRNKRIQSSGVKKRLEWVHNPYKDRYKGSYNYKKNREDEDGD